MISKKRLKMLLIIIGFIFIILYCNNVYAASKIDVLAAFDDDSISAGEEVILDVEIGKMEDVGAGINAYVFELGFDTNELEFVKIEGKNGWNTPSYNQENIKSGKAKFAATNPQFTNKTGSVATITLKAKKNFDSENIPMVKISNISFAAKINNTTQKVLAEDMYAGSASSDNNEKKQEEEKEESSEIKKTSTGIGEYKGNSTTGLATTILPNTGIRAYQLIGVLVVLLFAVGIFYYKYKKLKKYV